MENKIHRGLLNLYYIQSSERTTLEQVGEQMGYSSGYVRTMHRKALKEFEAIANLKIMGYFQFFPFMESFSGSPKSPHRSPMGFWIC